jgi:hypothetical protein
MIVFKGRGYLIAILGFGCLLLSDWLTSVYFQDKDYYSRHGWPKLAGFAVSGVLVFLFSSLGEETLPGAQAAPQRAPLLRSVDSLFFIPAKYWSIIFGLLGVVFYFVRN